MRANLYQNYLPDGNSQTTLELRHFIENGSVLFDTTDKYPIWDENHREVLNKKIIEHYYLRQIGFETFGRFKFKLNVKMREIMPFYVELYKTTQFDYNPIENYSMTEGSEEKTTSKGTSKGNGLQTNHDTPQNDVANLDTHISSATKQNSEGTSEGTSDNVREAWRRGNIGVTTSQQMIQQERDLIINIDMMIIDELQDLFLGVY